MKEIFLGGIMGFVIVLVVATAFYIRWGHF
jgi:hypothetical protein